MEDLSEAQESCHQLLIAVKVLEKQLKSQSFDIEKIEEAFEAVKDGFHELDATMEDALDYVH